MNLKQYENNEDSPENYPANFEKGYRNQNYGENASYSTLE